MKHIKEKRYSAEELQSFKRLLLEKLETAKHELGVLEKILSRQEQGIVKSSKMFEDNAEIAETENIGQLAERQQKFLKQIEDALVRIQDGTYGICVNTGNLISKERLKVVPHTMYSVESKLPKRPMI